jgi:eukaryotic-like serine/threonine-protein kinase
MSPDTRRAQSLVGSVLEGGYRVERLVGEGGMGAVYEATHLRLGKRVAIKVMARELSANQEALARFHREAVITGGMGDAHIVQVFDFNITPDGEPFLVMEFLQGEDLEQRLLRATRLSPEETVSIVSQVASALTASHAQAIIHRDLKPANIYLLESADQSIFVKVLDFGISKVRSAATQLTRATSIIGTPRYMSPEQAKGRSDDIDERADQWALACIAWECLSGESPFVGEDLPSVLYQIVHEAPQPLLPRVPGLSSEVEKVLLHALAKDKTHRFASVGEFASALDDAVAGKASAATEDSPTAQPPWPDFADERPKKGSTSPSTFSQTATEVDDEEIPAGSRRARTYAIAAVGFAILLSGAYLLLRPGARPKTVVASPPLVIPREPVVQAPPPPQPEPPAAVLPPPSRPEPASPDAGGPVVDPKAKKIAHPPKSRPMATPFEITPPPSEPQPAHVEPPPPSNKESQQKWRLD